MKLIHVVFYLLIFQSCKDRDQTPEITTAAPKLKVPDSIVATEQYKAIGEIKFGISEKQFNKQKEEFEKQTEVETYPGSGIMNNMIGKYRYYWLSGFFENDKLYKVMLRGKVIEYSEYDKDIKEQFESLYYNLKTKYGEATSYLGLPSWSRINDQRVINCASWKIGIRTIEMTITRRGTNYNLDFLSFKTAIEDSINNAEYQKKRAIEEKTSKSL